MPKKCIKAKALQHEGKENISFNGHNHQLNMESKPLSIKKELRLQCLQEGSMDPQQLRLLCEKQEELVLAEKKSKRLDHEFFELVHNKLADSKIYHQIMKIKEMTNEEAMDEFFRIQNQKTKVSESYVHYSSTNNINTIIDDEGSDNEILDKEVFKQFTKQVSMIEQNDDAYLEELGAQNYEINSLKPINDMEDEMLSEEEKIGDSHYARYEIDDIFEL